MALRELSADEAVRVAGGYYYGDTYVDDGGGGGGYDYGEGTVSNISEPVYGADELFEFEVTETYDSYDPYDPTGETHVQHGMSQREASGILRYAGTAISVATLFIPATAPIRGAIYVFRGVSWAATSMGWTIRFAGSTKKSS